MDRLPEIKAAYDWFVAQYETEVKELARNNDLVGIGRMDIRRDMLERGVFVLMFGQFEKAIRSAFDTAISARINNPDWTRRRGWDTASLRSRNVPFATKLAMVLDSQTSSFGRIIRTYDMRNHCAHGGTTDAVGSIDALEADLYQWQSELQR